MQSRSWYKTLLYKFLIWKRGTWMDRNIRCPGCDATLNVEGMNTHVVIDAVSDHCSYCSAKLLLHDKSVSFWKPWALKGKAMWRHDPIFRTWTFRFDFDSNNRFQEWKRARGQT